MGCFGKKGQTKTTGRPVSEETRKKLSESLKASEKATKWSDERRKKHSEAMKKAVLENPESYSSSNRGRTEQIIVDRFKTTR
jgi:ABC-type nitrate/sulfonate/bicarbonate transport system substrate-binding protein